MHGCEHGRTVGLYSGRTRCGLGQAAAEGFEANTAFGRALVLPTAPGDQLLLSAQRATRRRNEEVVASIENVEIGCDAHFSSVQEWITSVFLCSFEPLVCFAPFLSFFHLFSEGLKNPHPSAPESTSHANRVEHKLHKAYVAQVGSGWLLGLVARVGLGSWDICVFRGKVDEFGFPH